MDLETRNLIVLTLWRHAIELLLKRLLIKLRATHPEILSDFRRMSEDVLRELEEMAAALATSNAGESAKVARETIASIKTRFMEWSRLIESPKEDRTFGLY